MDAALIASAALLGLAGTPHCATMCSAPCAAVTGPRGPGVWAFHASRMAGYAAAGVVASASVGSLAALSQWTPALRPLWMMFHGAMLVLGLWMLIQARQPAWMGRIGRAAPGAGVPAVVWVGRGGPGVGTASARTWSRTTGATLAGAVWVAWPCGLLQSALLVSSLTQTPWWGGAAMAAFALSSAAGLFAAPALWRWLGSRADAPMLEAWIVRAAGGLLAGAALLALGRDFWHPIAVFCGLA